MKIHRNGFLPQRLRVSDGRIRADEDRLTGDGGSEIMIRPPTVVSCERRIWPHSQALKEAVACSSKGACRQKGFTCSGSASGGRSAADCRGPQKLDLDAFGGK